MKLATEWDKKQLVAILEVQRQHFYNCWEPRGSEVYVQDANGRWMHVRGTTTETFWKNASQDFHHGSGPVIALDTAFPEWVATHNLNRELQYDSKSDYYPMTSRSLSALRSIKELHCELFGSAPCSSPLLDFISDPAKQRLCGTDLLRAINAARCARVS
jgi:hypothetical protein